MEEVKPKGRSRFKRYLKSDADGLSWTPGISTTYQGPLSGFNPYGILDASGLSSGTYIFYFGVDMGMDGVIDASQLCYDTVVVDVK